MNTFEPTLMQRDALLEMFNIGVGRASKALSQLLGCEIVLSVPELISLRVKNLTEAVGPWIWRDGFCAVSRKVDEPFVEMLMMLDGAVESLMAGSSGSSTFKTREDVAVKIATLVTDSCLDQMEDVLAMALNRGEPVFSTNLDGYERSDGVFNLDLLATKIDWGLKGKDVTGVVYLLVSSKGLKQLCAGFDRMFEENGG